MDRNPNSPSLVSNRTGNGLTDPPSRISWKLKSFGVVKLINGLHQPHVSFLNQIKELHTTADIALGNGNNQTKIGLSQTLLGFQVSLFYQDSQLLLFFIAEKRHNPDFFQIHADWVIDLGWIATQELFIGQFYFFLFSIQDTCARISFLIRDRNPRILNALQQILNPISVQSERNDQLVIDFIVCRYTCLLVIADEFCNLNV